MLVFLPGQAEIAPGRGAARPAPARRRSRCSRCTAGCPSRGSARRSPRWPARRKLVLATAIAETSLTIPDVRVVVDGGRARRARFDPGSGMSRLVTERVTRAEAEQRRGRAGRRGARLVLPALDPRRGGGARGLSAARDRQRRTSRRPRAGARALGRASAPTAWRSSRPPPAPALAEARALLAELGALDAGGRVTDARPRASPRCRCIPASATCCWSPRRRARATSPPTSRRCPGARPAARAGRPRPGRPRACGSRRCAIPRGVEAEHPVAVDRGRHRGAARRGAPPAPPGAGDADGPGLSPGAALSLAYPDRIGQRRPGPQPRYLLAGGKGAALPRRRPAGRRAADRRGRPRRRPARGADPPGAAGDRGRAPRRCTPTACAARAVCDWSRRDRAVLAARAPELGRAGARGPALARRPAERADRRRMLDGIRDLGLDALPWTRAARRLAARVEWLRAQGEPTCPTSRPTGLTGEPEATGSRRISAGIDPRRGPRPPRPSSPRSRAGSTGRPARASTASRPPTITAPDRHPAAGRLCRRGSRASRCGCRRCSA